MRPPITKIVQWLTQRRSWTAPLAGAIVCLAIDITINAFYSHHHRHVHGIWLILGFVALAAIIAAVLLAGLAALNGYRGRDGRRPAATPRPSWPPTNQSPAASPKPQAAGSSTGTLAQDLLAKLLTGAQPPTLIAKRIRLADDEVVFFDAHVTIARYEKYWGTETYLVGSIWDGRQTQRRRVRLGPRWQSKPLTRLCVTNHRIICHTGLLRRADSYHYTAITSLALDPKRHHLDLQLSRTTPLRISGPAAEPVAVLIVWAAGGINALLTEPALTPLRR